MFKQKDTLIQIRLLQAKLRSIISKGWGFGFRIRVEVFALEGVLGFLGRHTV